MKILLVYPGARYSTFDVARGYERALTELGHTVWPFRYDKYLTFFNGAFSFWETRNPEYHKAPIDYVREATRAAVMDAVDFVPDVALVVAGQALHPLFYDNMAKLRIPVVLLCTESPYEDAQQAALIRAGGVRLVFTNERESVIPLRAATGAAAEVFYLPHAFDPALHYPRPADAEHTTRVFFHGTLWPERQQMLAGLERIPGARISGLRVSERSNGQHASAIDDDELAGLMLDNAELAQWYNGTDIAVNQHRHDPTHTAYSLGPRAFEIAACGAFQLCDRGRGELRAVFHGAVATYGDAADLVSQTHYFLEHPRERLDMARAAYALVQPCTFKQRAAEILIPALAEVCDA